MNAARALRLGPVFRKLSVDEIATLVAEVDALEQGLDRPVPARVNLTPAAVDGVDADEMAVLRAAQKKRRERDERALAQQRRRVN